MVVCKSGNFFLKVHANAHPVAFVNYPNPYCTTELFSAFLAQSDAIAQVLPVSIEIVVAGKPLPRTSASQPLQ